MSAVRKLLADLALIGERLEPAGDRLILRAGPTAIPLVGRVREAKVDLLATLAACTDRSLLLGGDRLDGLPVPPGYRDSNELDLSGLTVLRAIQNI